MVQREIHLKLYIYGGGFKRKLDEDVGQPEIRAGDTRVSHTCTSLKGECGTPWYHQ